jgi:hypothetical protein
VRSTRRTVVAPTRGNAPRRRVRCGVVSDQVAVPSSRRSGGRCAVATIAARAAGSYVTCGPRPGAMSSAASPRRLNRATKSATAVPLRKPARRAASAKVAPVATANRAVARRARATRPLLALPTPVRVARSSSVSARRRSFGGGAILPSSRPPLYRTPPSPSPVIRGVTH